MHVVAVAGTFSCDPYERWLRAWLSAVGLSVDVEVRMAAYGQLIQELTAPSAFQGANVCIAEIESHWKNNASYHSKIAKKLKFICLLNLQI